MKYLGLLGVASLILLSPALVNAYLTGSLSPEAISERLKPMGQVNVLGVDPSAAAATAATGAGLGGPAKIYTDNCKMCHQTGLAGAPKFGNKADWASRMPQGLDVMVKTAMTGIRGMPPKGNCLKCTEQEIRETVQYMLDQLK